MTPFAQVSELGYKVFTTVRFPYKTNSKTAQDQSISNVLHSKQLKLVQTGRNNNYIILVD